MIVITVIISIKLIAKSAESRKIGKKFYGLSRTKKKLKNLHHKKNGIGNGKKLHRERERDYGSGVDGKNSQEKKKRV